MISKRHSQWLEPNTPSPLREHFSDLSFHLLKPGISASLALQMAEKRRQANKLPSATSLLPWTVIQLFAMLSVIQVVVQLIQRYVLAMANITFVAVSVPAAISSFVLLVPFEELVGDDAIGVTLADLLVNGLAVDVLSLRTRSILEMVGDAGRGYKAASAERTFYLGSLMNAGVKVLETERRRQRGSFYDEG